MKNTRKPVSFWKPVEYKRKRKFSLFSSNSKINGTQPINSIKPVKLKFVKLTPAFQKTSSFKPFSFKKIKLFSPIKLEKYPSRTKSEWKLIDRKPFGDKDRDKVPNIFDCKPLNKKKQGAIFYRDKEGRPKLIRAVNMMFIPEKFKNTKIENAEQFEKVSQGINEVTAKLLSGRPAVKPFFMAALSKLHDKGYTTRQSSSKFNKNTQEIETKIILNERINRNILDKLNKNVDDVQVYVNEEGNTVLTFNQKGKTILDIEKEMDDFINNKIPIHGMSPQIAASSEILKRLKKYEDSDINEIETDKLLKPLTLGVMEEEMEGTESTFKSKTPSLKMPKILIKGSKREIMPDKEFQVQSLFVPEAAKRMEIEPELKAGIEYTTNKIKEERKNLRRQAREERHQEKKIEEDRVQEEKKLETEKLEDQQNFLEEAEEAEDVVPEIVEVEINPPSLKEEKETKKEIIESEDK